VSPGEGELIAAKQYRENSGIKFVVYPNIWRMDNPNIFVPDSDNKKQYCPANGKYCPGIVTNGKRSSKDPFKDIDTKKETPD
jgi:hypothetical protein